MPTIAERQKPQKNTRELVTLELNSLRRINIVTGANGSGKSAILEALFCAARGNVESFLYTNTLRNLNTPNLGIFGPLPVDFHGLSVTPQSFRALWDHLFYTSGKNDDRKIADIIKLHYSDTGKLRYEVEISFMDGGQPPLPPEPSEIGSATGPNPLRISRNVVYTDGRTQPTSSLFSLNPQGQLQGTSPLLPFGPSAKIFSSVMNYAEIDNVAWFSRLREKGQHVEIVKFIREQFPFVDDLVVLAPFGASAIFASLKSGGMRRLQLVSSGINKIIAILLACANSKNGIILIDEIENGIYYDKYQFMWSVLYKFAKDFDCQIFATSHSAECLGSLPEVIGDQVDDFSLIRTERENEKCIARHISGMAMKAALKGGNEVRGGEEKWVSPE